MAHAPSRAELDDAVLRQLAAAGSDLSQPHDIEHAMVFPAESGAAAAAQQLEQEGYRVVVSRHGGPWWRFWQKPYWLCEATGTLVPEPEVVHRATHHLQSLAAQHGGEYDGWGSCVVS